jgi:hypothetical protein
LLARLVAGAADPLHRLAGDADVGALLPSGNDGAGTALLLHLGAALRTRKERQDDCQHPGNVRLTLCGVKSASG